MTTPDGSQESVEALCKMRTTQLRAIYKIRRDQTPLDVAVALCNDAADLIDSLSLDNATLRKRAEFHATQHGRLKAMFPTGRGEVTELRARLAEIEKDARRYKWLRGRLEIRKLAALSGSKRMGLSVRIGHAFLDSDKSPGDGWIDPAKFVESCVEVDDAIDAALASREENP